MTNLRFNFSSLRNPKFHRRTATIRILSRLGFSPAEIARIDGNCTAWDIIEYHRFIERFRAHIEEVNKGTPAHD